MIWLISWNSEVFSVISGLVGTFTDGFINKKPRGEGVGEKSDAKISAINGYA